MVVFGGSIGVGIDGCCVVGVAHRLMCVYVYGTGGVGIVVDHVIVIDDDNACVVHVGTGTTVDDGGGGRWCCGRGCERTWCKWCTLVLLIYA